MLNSEAQNQHLACPQRMRPLGRQPAPSTLLFSYSIRFDALSNFGCSREPKPFVRAYVCVCVLLLLLLLLLSAPRVSIALRLFVFVCAYNTVCFHMFMFVLSDITPVFQTYTSASRKTQQVYDVKVHEPVQTVLNIIHTHGELERGNRSNCR